MALQISPFGNSQFLTTGGKPASGYQLFVYEGRSATKRTVYTDRNGVGKHTNPIILDANGFAPSPIYLDTTLTYKFVLASELDQDPPTVPMYTVDQVSVGLETPTTATAEWITGTTPTYLSASSFSVTGDQRTTYHVGRRIKAVTGAGSLYGTVTASAFGASTTVTVSLDLGTLDGTLSAIFYSFLSASGSSWPGGYSTGPGVRTLALPNGPSVGPLICYEIIFPDEVVQGDSRPQWLVNMTDDSWFGPWVGPYQHLGIARVRAVEEGLPVARAANTGVSAIIDPFGRIVSSLDLDKEGVLDSSLPEALPKTLYERVGDVLFFVFLLLTAIVGRKWRARSR